MLDHTAMVSSELLNTINDNSQEFLHIINLESLQMAYMHFIKNGGLFIQTNKAYNLGDELSYQLKLLTDSEIFAVTGKVIWVNPKCTQGGLPEGVGIQFTGEKSKHLVNKITSYLAGASEQNTYTM